MQVRIPLHLPRLRESAVRYTDMVTCAAHPHTHTHTHIYTYTHINTYLYVICTETLCHQRWINRILVYSVNILSVFSLKKRRECNPAEDCY